MAYLIVVLPTGEDQVTLQDTTYLGRAPECDLILADASVSRRHARISKEQGRFVLYDEKSHFGTSINGDAVQAQALREGDRILLGSVELVFHSGEAQAGTAAEGPTTTPIEALTGGVEEKARRALHLELQQTRSLLAFQHALVRCTSLPMVMQGAGPELLRALRAERLLLLSFNEAQNSFGIHFQHGLDQIPAARVEQVDAAFGSGSLRQMVPDEEGRIGLAVPVLGGERYPQGMIYAEFPPGRVPLPEEIRFSEGLCEELASVLTHHRLLAQIRDETQTRANLSRYLPAQVVEAVIAGDINMALGGEMRTVTVLFTDIRSFTSLSEHMPPEHVLGMLNGYFSEAVPIIKRYEGTVDKFIGDALMAVFGAPAPQEDQAMRAVQAAIEVRDLVRRLRTDWVRAPWAEHMEVSRFAVGVGVNTGPAVAGNLGSDDRREYGVIGDAVNVAARLCSKAGPDQILIGGGTAAAVSGRFGLDKLEPMSVKGRAQQVQAYQVNQ